LLKLIVQHSQVEPTIKPTVKLTLEPTVELTIEPTVKLTIKPIVKTTVGIPQYTIQADRNQFDDIHPSIHNPS
jgi:hypothetical protein